MNDAAATKVLGEALGIGHVVSMRQEDVGDTAKRLQALDQRTEELRRVNQPVAVRVSNEVAVAAIRLRRVVPAVEDRLFNDEREVPHHWLRIVVTKTAD